MVIPMDFYSAGWMTFGKINTQGFKKPENKLGDKDCCAEKHRKPHDGKLDVEA